MYGWILFITVLCYQFATEGVVDTLTGLASSLGVDAVVALVTGTGFDSIFTGAGLADDVIFMLFKLGFNTTDKILLAVAIENAAHIARETYEQWDHTDEENQQWSEYLSRVHPQETYVFGDVTRKDVIELGFSAGLLYRRGKFASLYDAALDKFGGLVTPTSDVIAIGGEL